MEAVLGGVRDGGRRRARLVPVAVAALLLGIGACALAYRAAAASGAFDVSRIQVVGAADAAAQVDAAARAGIAGRSMLDVDPAAVARAVAALPGIQRASVDRAFPATLVVHVVPERPIAIVRTSAGGRVISATGRVIGPAAGSARLPAIAASPADIPGVGGAVRSTAVLDEVAVAAAPHAGLRLRSIGYTGDGLVAQLRDGTQIRLGDGTNAARKLRVAHAVLRRAAGPVEYVDVSVPDAPAVRAGTPDPATTDAPPAPAPPLTGQSAAPTAGTPTENARAVFG